VKRFVPVIVLASLALAGSASTGFAHAAGDAAATPATSENAEKAAKAVKADKADKADKAADSENAVKADKADKAEKAEKADRADNADTDAESGDPVTPAAPAAQPQPAAPAPAKEEKDDAVFKPAEPDYTLISLPTGLRLPQFKGALRVTHRFSRPLTEGSFGDLANDLFAFDSAAQIGLEFRFGLMPGWQAGLHRTSDRDIQFFTQYSVFEQSEKLPISVSAMASIDGQNNFKDSKSPGLGAIVSRTFGKIGALYFEPMWVNNTNPEPKELVDHNNTFFIGIGGRVQVRKDLYVVAEAMPRVSGYKPGVNGGGFGVEKHVGGHIFQLNFGKGFGTTMTQIARGGPASNDWFIGFNLTRKFF
jgi:hypothetical protein